MLRSLLVSLLLLTPAVLLAQDYEISVEEVNWYTCSRAQGYIHQDFTALGNTPVDVVDYDPGFRVWGHHFPSVLNDFSRATASGSYPVANPLATVFSDSKNWVDGIQYVASGKIYTSAGFNWETKATNSTQPQDDVDAVATARGASLNRQIWIASGADYPGPGGPPHTIELGIRLNAAIQKNQGFNSHTQMEIAAWVDPGNWMRATLSQDLTYWIITGQITGQEINHTTQNNEYPFMLNEIHTFPLSLRSLDTFKADTWCNVAWPDNFPISTGYQDSKTDAYLETSHFRTYGYGQIFISDFNPAP